MKLLSSLFFVSAILFSNNSFASKPPSQKYVEKSISISGGTSGNAYSILSNEGADNFANFQLKSMYVSNHFALISSTALTLQKQNEQKLIHNLSYSLGIGMAVSISDNVATTPNVSIGLIHSNNRVSSIAETKIPFEIFISNRVFVEPFVGYGALINKKSEIMFSSGFNLGVRL